MAKRTAVLVLRFHCMMSLRFLDCNFDSKWSGHRVLNIQQQPPCRTAVSLRLRPSSRLPCRRLVGTITARSSRFCLMLSRKLRTLVGTWIFLGHLHRTGVFDNVGNDNDNTGNHITTKVLNRLEWFVGWACAVARANGSRSRKEGL